MQPRIKNIKTRRKAVKAFKGICLRESIPDGYFAEAENLSARGYPAICQRKVRGVFENCAGVGAMYSHGEMVWTMGSSLYYGSEYIGSVMPGGKQFASLGAYVVIYPDKKILNTQTLELTPIENSVTVSGVYASISNADGSEAPSSNYVKIASSGIGRGFSVGDAVEISGFSDEMLNGSFLLQTVSDDFIVIIAVIDEGASEEGEITVKRSAPDLDFLTSSMNRVWGVSNQTHEIRACKLGDAKNWNVFQGISTDSYAASVPSAGVFTGCAELQGSAVFFKEEEIIKLFGDKPSNFELVSSRMPGVEAGAENSIAYMESMLFYKGQLGVYRYDGSIPVIISDALGWGHYRGGSAGAVDGRYYISMTDQYTGKYVLFVYDVNTGAWYTENGLAMRCFTRAGKELYMICADGNAYSVNGGGPWYDPEKLSFMSPYLVEAYVKWHAVTGLIALTAPDRQYVSRIHIRFSLKSMGRLTVALKYAGEDEFINCAYFDTPSSEKTFSIPVQARRADSVFLKIEGRGECTITGIDQTYETGSDGLWDL